MRSKQYVKPSKHPAFTRFNLFLRDKFACQYCGSPNDLTFDHVIPRRAGGRTTWENVATACSPCNLKKGGRTPKEAHMQLHVTPIRPTSRPEERRVGKEGVSPCRSWGSPVH